MRFNELRSIAHNVADSLASGMGFLIGCYGTDIYGEARQSPEGHITVDFLAGTSTESATSPSLARAISLYSEALDDLCKRHGTTKSAFRTLSACFRSGLKGGSFVVTVEDTEGRLSVDTYSGLPGKRIMIRDDQGRPRRPTGSHPTIGPDYSGEGT